MVPPSNRKARSPTPCAVTASLPREMGRDCWWRDRHTLALFSAAGQLFIGCFANPNRHTYAYPAGTDSYLDEHPALNIYADPDVDGDCHRDAEANPYADAHADPNAKPHPDAHIHAHADPNADPNAESDADAHADPDADAHADADALYPNLDAVAYTYSYAGANAAATATATAATAAYVHAGAPSAHGAAHRYAVAATDQYTTAAPNGNVATHTGRIGNVSSGPPTRHSAATPSPVLEYLTSLLSLGIMQ
jgi:hypothetical protein